MADEQKLENSDEEKDEEGVDDRSPNSEKVISLPETILIMEYVILLDLIGIGLAFAALDDFFILDLLSTPVTQFYFRMKGVKSTADLISSGLELIPYVGSLPIKSVGVAITIYMANHPKVMKVATMGVADKIAAAKRGNLKDAASS